MTCIEARAALLEADLEELRGTADTPLARHLRDCAACRAAAERIVRTEGALARRLAALPPRREALRTPATRRRTRHPWRWAVPLAAAATIVALIVTRPGQRPPPGDAPVASGRPGPSPVAVTAPAGRNVAVFETADPDIVIIWFF
jgi:hypothetical protein